MRPSVHKSCQPFLLASESVKDYRKSSTAEQSSFKPI